MKRLIATTALSLALAAPAAADVTMLRDTLETDFVVESLNVDVSTLTDEQVRAIYVTTSVGENDPGATRQAVQAIVDDETYVMDETAIDPATLSETNSLRTAVSQMLATNLVDADVSDLSNEQVIALYFELTSGDQTDMGDLEAIIDG